MTHKLLRLTLAIGLAFILFSGGVQAEEITIDAIPAVCTCTCNFSFDPENIPSLEDLEIEAEADLSSEYSVSPDDIVISEFVADPVSNESEWVELYNQTAYNLDLTDWYLLEGAGRRTDIAEIIPAGSYLVVETTNLNNSGDTIIVKNHDDVVITSLDYGDFNSGVAANNAPSHIDPDSVIRLPDSSYAVTEVPTPGEPNVFISPIIEVDDSDEINIPLVETGGDDVVISSDESDESQDSSTEPSYELSPDIMITEIFPDPAGADSNFEWVELFNSGSSAVNLSGWILDDIDGGSSPYVISESLIIPGLGYQSFDKSVTGLSLNNNEDSVRLIDPIGAVISSIDYSRAVEGQSYGYAESGWFWSEDPSPGEVNATPLTETEDQMAVADVSTSTKTNQTKSKTELNYKIVLPAEIKNLVKGDLVETSGVVAVPPNDFSAKIGYLDGVQIYNSKAAWPNLSRGDRVTVRGKVSEYFSEKRILIDSVDDVIMVDSGELAPLKIDTRDFTPEIVGRYVRFDGKIVDRSGSKLTLADDYGEGLAVIKADTGISSAEFSSGDNVNIIGVLSQYKDEIRLMPASPADIVVPELAAREAEGLPGASQLLPLSVSSRTPVVVISIISALALLAVWQRKFLSEQMKKIIGLIRAKLNQPIV
ncbi:TPA: hypothetical protein DF272_01935 [Candidatus Falkowbacteria bacterium]|nr:hypothetical protein [Candidatus Falkowbacteria bacterium]